MTPKLKSYIERNRRVIDKALDRLLPKASETPKLIHKAMRYSIFAGGKRLRPFLVMAGAEACGGNSKTVIPLACAFEMIHTYSLIHDDLPAMDNDDLRRGRPTSHKVFGEDMAILAGDALLTHAFHVVHKNTSKNKVKIRDLSEVLRIMTQGAGTPGMIGGQVADIMADGGKWKRMKINKNGLSEFRSPKQLLAYIHAKKTAALISASLEAGGTMVGANPKKRAALRKYGEAIGLAFQVRDDVLDRVGDKKKLGKRGSDQTNQKLTFPALYGLENSRNMAQKYINLAHRALKPFGKKAEILHQLADFVNQRDH